MSCRGIALRVSPSVLKWDTNYFSRSLGGFSSDSQELESDLHFLKFAVSNAQFGLKQKNVTKKPRNRKHTLFITRISRIFLQLLVRTSSSDFSSSNLPSGKSTHFQKSKKGSTTKRKSGRNNSYQIFDEMRHTGMTVKVYNFGKEFRISLILGSF